MVRIGIVGVGFMGMIHYLAAQKLKGARVTAETASAKSGNFEFKGLPSGNYWFVAIVDQQQYAIPVVVRHTAEKLPVCSEMTFAIEDSGKFDLRVRAPRR